MAIERDVIVCLGAHASDLADGTPHLEWRARGMPLIFPARCADLINEPILSVRVAAKRASLIRFGCRPR